MRYAVFLRALNVGRANRITMERLRRLAGESGATSARTHLQNGNLVVDSALAPEALAASLEERLAAEGLRNVSAIVRTTAELADVLAACPFDAFDPERYRRLVTFFRSPLDAHDAARLAALDGVVAVREREVVHVSELAQPMRGDPVQAVVAKLDSWATVRYWHVAADLLRLVEGPA